jgi:Cdc6-like AAA superfamily ATPase
MDDADKITLKFRLGQIFTPSAPISKSSLFAGRQDQISELINTVNSRGQHAALFGERGVGKTSLATVLKEFIGPFDFIFVSTNCDASTTFKSICDNLVDEIAVACKKAGKGFKTAEGSTQDIIMSFLSDKPTPEQMRHLFEDMECDAIVLIDELDRVRDKATTTRLADLIKTLSDHAVGCTFIMAGVADSLDNLIAEHLSIERALVQIKMPRMSSSELEQITAKGLHEVSMSIEAEATKRISKLSHGLPHYTHALSLHAAQTAVDRGSMVVSKNDVLKAISKTISGAQQTVVRAYHDATSSPRGNLYSEVLLACALAETDDLGYFPASAVRGPMSKIMKKPYEIPAFSRHMNDFCEASRGKILQRTGFPRRYRFRFVNPLMEPYVVMKGIAAKLIKSD